MTGCVFLDLKKAFVTTSHQVLVEMLELYGICGLESKWFEGYLHERKQVVKLGDEVQVLWTLM